mgnify:CR=1 FL=1
MNKRIAILLPYKEDYNKNNAGSASLWVKDFFENSKLKKITSLNLSEKGVNDLTGIEDFLSLKVLIANDNLISKIDLSLNTELEILIQLNAFFILTEYNPGLVASYTVSVAPLNGKPLYNHWYVKFKFGFTILRVAFFP